MHSQFLIDEDCDPLGSFVQLNTACLAKNMTLGVSVHVCVCGGGGGEGRVQQPIKSTVGDVHVNMVIV